MLSPTRMTLAIALAVLNFAVVCVAAPPSKTVDDERDRAPLHVTVSVDKVALPSGEVGMCTVEGTVTIVHRDRTTLNLQKGRTIELTFDCKEPGARVEPSGVLYVSTLALRSARTLSAYLRSTGAGFEVVNGSVNLHP